MKQVIGLFEEGKVQKLFGMFVGSDMSFKDDYSYLNENFEDYKKLENELPKSSILAYMESLTHCCLAPMISHDIFSKEVIPNPGFYEDGIFIFPTDFLYYFKNYEIGIPYEYENFLKTKIHSK